MTENLALWELVEKTPPEHTKAITGKSYSGNSPKPHYLIRKATATFGPCGIGWGFTVEERVEDGAMIEPGFYEKLHVAKVRVWFKWNGERGEVEHIGGTTFSGKRKNGALFTDEDAPKKSVTDALVKALSMIGFAGDIFMGRYDDSKYVAELKREAAQGSAAAPQKSAAAPSDADGAAHRFIASLDEIIAGQTDAAALIRWWNSEEQKQARRDFGLSQMEVNAVKNKLMAKVESLNPQTEAAQ